MPAPDAAPRDAEDLALLLDAAQAAAPVAMGHFRDRPAAWDKPGGAGPVSEADLAVDALLRETLLAARPDYGWLSEETEDDPARLERASVFIVDPIDGTRAFLNGDPGFAHALAVVRDGRVTAAVVHLPAMGLTYAARAGGGATLNGHPLRVGEGPDMGGARLLGGKAVLAPAHWPGGVPPVTRAFRTSLAWRLCLVAEGRYDATMALRSVWEWDSAAASLIALEAGVTVTDRTGAALGFNAAHPAADGLLAAPPRLHGQLLARMHHGEPGEPMGQ